MTALEWTLIGVIAANFVWKWAKKDNSDYRDMTRRFSELNAKYEDAYAKMRSRIEDEGEKVEVMLERCRKTLERLHGVDMAKRTEEWQSENAEEMERIERKRELKRNPYGF